MGNDDEPIGFEMTDEGLPIGLCEDCEVDLRYETYLDAPSWASQPTGYA